MFNCFRNSAPTLLLGVSSLFLLSSCELPPKQAWRKIRTDGLFAYIAYETGGGQYRYLNRQPTPSTMPPATNTRPMSLLAGSPQSFYTPPGPSQVTPALSQPTLTALPVPSLAGFVRSPYTNPPRLVDVKGAAAGATLICPYTHRPFVVPAGRAQPQAPRTMLAGSTPAPYKPLPLATPDLTGSPLPTPPAPVLSQVPEVPAHKPAPPAPAVKALVKPAPAPEVAVAPPKPADQPLVSPQPAPTPPPAANNDQLPYGTPIAGRPGFVNSPYAEKHQLVDVTGLPSGIGVRCPYTGKQFRVPAQEMITTKPEDPPAVASPEKK